MIFEVGLYPVITEEFCAGRSITDVLHEILTAGVKIVQLRQKNICKKKLYEQSIIFRQITNKYNALLIINDHIDIALSVNADGVHLGQDDLPLEAARKIAPNLIIGVSTHNQPEIDEAVKHNASYINIGPIFSTKTKETGIAALGLEYLKNAKVNIPFTVMGGIKKENIREVLECGAGNIAMVTEVTMAPDITARTKELINIINEYR